MVAQFAVRERSRTRAAREHRLADLRFRFMVSLPDLLFSV